MMPLLKPHPSQREWRTASPHPPTMHTLYTMATDYSTETTAKLLKAIHPETDTLWVLCVDLSMCVYGACYNVCYWKETRCIKATAEVVSQLVSSG